jgi:hypothetical protein
MGLMQTLALSFPTHPHTVWSLTVLMLLSAGLSSAATTWYVSTTGTDSPSCGTATAPCQTISYALNLAAPSGDTIFVGRGGYAGNLTINKSIRLIGSGSNRTIIDGGGKVSVITVGLGQTVTISGVTVQNGFTYYCGGGIVNAGLLTLSSIVVTGNTAVLETLTQGAGGGICNSGSMTIDTSTISGNTASIGGGIHNGGLSLTIYRSTFTGNSATSAGGGLFNVGPAIVIDSTIAGNSSVYGGGVCAIGDMTIASSTISANSASSTGLGGGVRTHFGIIITLMNTIIGGNTGSTDPDCAASIQSQGYNLIENTSGCTITGGPSDITGMSPMLGALASNGGPTQTMALQTGSPAIDAGNPAGCASPTGPLLTVDQRGAPRVSPPGGRCDIGAYELTQ